MSLINKKTLFFVVLIINLSGVFALTKQDYLQIIKNPKTSDSAKYNAYFELGWEYVSSPSDTSFYYASKAFIYAKKLNSRFYQAKVFNLLGAYFQTKGTYAKAVDYYQNSLRIGDRINNKEIKLAALGNIGTIYLHTAKYDKALEYLQKSETISDSLNPNLPNIYNNLSITYVGLNQNEKALLYAEKALALFDKYGNEQAKSMTYASIATAQNKLGNYKEALIHFKKSLKLSIANMDLYQEIDAYYGIAKTFKELNVIDSSIFYANLTSKKGLEINHYTNVAAAKELLVAIYKEKKQFEKALLMQEEYQKYKDIQVAESEEQMIEQKIIEFNFDKRLHDDSLKNAFSLLERDKKIKENLAQIKQDKLFKIGLFSLIVLALGFAVFAYNRFKISESQKLIIEKQNKETLEQKEIITQKNNAVFDSINYAKRIQEGLLASKQTLNENLEDYYILFKPKDIVSGDFYWSAEYGNQFYLAVCDSTGHGVPGAFMSLLNIALLSEAIKEKQIKEPHLIFTEVRRRLIEIISADGYKDGFDGVLIRIEKTELGTKIEYVAANNEPILIRDGQFVKLQNDRIPVGKSDDLKPFNLYSIDVKQGDTLYLYTDGYADQFGGEKLKKFKRKNLNDLLLQNSHLEMDTQWIELNKAFEQWKGEEEQVDDVCVAGIKF